VVESILPSIERRAAETRLDEARSRLEQLANDRYLLVSIWNALQKGMERGRTSKEVVNSGLLEILPDEDEVGDVGYLAVEQALSDYVRGAQSTDLDRRILALRRADPEASASALAAELGAPERTVRERMRRMNEYVKRRLQN
jgi:hypothetical protein